MKSLSIVPIACFLLLSATCLQAVEPLRQFGFAKIDITPTDSLRLSGYGSRDNPSEGIDERLFTRAMALRETDGSTHLLVAIDTIGVSGVMTRQLQEKIEKKHGIPRHRFVICCSHSHTSPHLDLGLDNLFTVPLSKDEQQKTHAYTETLRQHVLTVVDQAITDLAPGRMFYAEGSARFARNRRVIVDGVWKGFGENPNGPVDHSLPMLKITDASGTTIRGLLFNYACHGTTFGGDHNRINGDWMGYACKEIEATNVDATALCCIGCGADANPPRDPEHATEYARAAGKEIGDEIKRMIGGEMDEVTAPVSATYGYAGLPIDRPSIASLTSELANKRPQVRRHAEIMLALYKRMGRLPETYPMPIQVWRFGDQFTMVFLGGEVVVEYALRIKKELKPGKIWVSAYSNDVFGYVASERMRPEGGYEVDFSMIYYNQPGRWETGTEDVIVRRIHELFENTDPQSPLSVDDALSSMTVAKGYAIDIVAAEPLIRDPISCAVGADGRLWVVEMGDYPRGLNDDGAAGGRIRVLTDTDGDGRYDKGVTFLEKLGYPTGVMPWRAGALVSVSPDLIYVEDRDGDGVADHREVLWSGFSEDNPQHRMSGFTYGLDNWLYLAGGTSHRAIRNVKTGETTMVSRRDIRIHPGQRRLELISGQSQYGRCRDDWGNWFGNNNTEPLYHFAIEDAFLARNPYAASPSPRVSMTTPARAPRVFPTSRTVDRFNDLFALDRFTSACAPHVFRDVTMGPDVSGAVFVCEPVHNLVSRVILRPDGVTFRGERHSSETGSEFLSSSDNWFRPVHSQTGPDGTLWVVDMYRMVIEHPEWIPESWQAKLNLYAGNNKGRIYRIRPVGGAGGKMLDLTTDSPVELTRKLDHSNGWVRDTAQRLLIERDDPESIGPLRRTLRESDNPLALLHALWTLEGLESLRDADLLAAFQSEHAGVVRAAVTIGGLRSIGGTDFHPATLAEHPNISVRYAVALAAGDSKDPALQLQVLKTIADQDLKDPWLRAAVVSSSTSCADELLAHVLKNSEPTPQRSVLASQLITTALAKDLASGTSGLLATIIPPSSGGIKDPLEVWQLWAIGDLVDALANRGSSIRKLAATPALQSQIVLASGRALATARTVAADEKAPIHAHLAAVRLLGRGVGDPAPDIDLLRSFLSPRISTEVQSTAIETLSAIDQPQILIAAMNSLTPKLRSEIQGILMTRPKGAGLLLDAIENKSILPTDLDAATRSSFIAYPSGAVRERAEKLLSDALQDRREVTEQFRESLDLEGDAQRGRELFTKRCAACHRLQKLGNEVGPQLSALQNKSREYLLTAILNPNQAVEAKYKVYTIATQQGVIHSGMIIDESATAITLARADGKKTTVLRFEIDEIVSGLSFMPEGLEKDLTLQDLADLLTFVQGKSQQRETPP